MGKLKPYEKDSLSKYKFDTNRINRDSNLLTIPAATLNAIMNTIRPASTLLLYCHLQKIALTGTDIFDWEEISTATNISKNKIRNCRNHLIEIRLLKLILRRGLKTQFVLFHKPYTANTPPFVSPQLIDRRGTCIHPPLKGGGNIHYTSNGKFNSTLVEDNSKKQSTNKSLFPRKMAIRLYKILKAKNKIKVKPNFSNWAQEFTNLQKQGYTKQHIIIALNWYRKNLRDPYTPKVYSAKTFKEKFQRILDAIERIDSIKKLEIQRELDRQIPYVDRVDPNNYDEDGRPIPKLGDDGEYYIE